MGEDAANSVSPFGAQGLTSDVSSEGRLVNLAAAAGGETQQALCPIVEDSKPLPPNKQVYRRATVAIGADVLGRIAVAADYDGDQLADELMLVL